MASRRSLSSLCLAFLLVSPLHAQDRVDSAEGSRKQATAVPVADGAIRVDGRLDEEIWQRVPAITDFVQKEPVEGAAPTERMEVLFVYDDSALYVGARMYSRVPSAIQAPMSRRDSVDTQAEYIFISLDTFLDRRTAYTFGVTATGVRFDRFHLQDDEQTADAGFDPVWEARTAVDEKGWTAELWIPFSQLRFNDQAEQIWGLNVRRFTPTLDEQDDWVLVPRTDRAWASRFGDLRGITRIRSMRRLELLPFLVGSSTTSALRAAQNPFDTGYNLASRVGLDMKMGLGPNLTLQTTANPDFGQVEADPAEVNLAAVPTRFAEKRPFFTEDSQLLNFTNTFFYSRRIGAKPSGAASGDFVDYPSATTILGAAKLTGRIRPRTSLGLLAAVTNEESARVFNGPSPGITEVRVAPRATYGLARLQQEFGRLGSTASLMMIGVHRSLDAEDPLASLLSGSAFTLGGDVLLRFKNGEYELRSTSGSSFVTGEPAAIERIQRSSAHYAQRPDKTYARLDPTLTSLSGFSTQNSFSRISGRHWLWQISTKIDSPYFEPNDFGIIMAADGIEPRGNIRYRETQPGRWLRNYSIGITATSEWDFGGNRQSLRVEPGVELTWGNFWTTSVLVRTSLRTTNSRLTRGGPLMGTPQDWYSKATLGNRATAQTRWSGAVEVGADEDGGITRRSNASFSFRPSPQWQLSMTPSYERLIYTQQYVTTLRGGRSATFSNRYVFAAIERSTFATQFRMNYTFKPDVNLDVYAEPFAASGRYYDYGELLAPGGRQRLQFGTFLQRQADGSLLASTGDTTFALANDDFNVRSFRSNVVLRWEWRPGSTLYLVWQQDRHAQEPVGTRVNVGDMFSSLTKPGTNVVLIKMSFWLPVT